VNAETRSAKSEQCSVTEDEDAVLDDIIEQIDRSLPTLLRMAPRISENGHPSPDSARRKRLFAQLAADPILTDDGGDIRLGNKTNGTHP
jgi:hypothetical protein